MSKAKAGFSQEVFIEVNYKHGIMFSPGVIYTRKYSLGKCFVPVSTAANQQMHIF